MVAAGDYKRTMIKNVILTEIIDFFLISRDIYDGGTDLVISKYQAQQFEIWNKWVWHLKLLISPSFHIKMIGMIGLRPLKSRPFKTWSKGSVNQKMFLK